jgi:hypothetical protein
MKVAASFLKFFKDVSKYDAKFLNIAKNRVTMATFGNQSSSLIMVMFIKVGKIFMVRTLF